MIWSIYCYISRDSRMLPVSIGGCLAIMVFIGTVNSKCTKYYGGKCKKCYGRKCTLSIWR